MTDADASVPAGAAARAGVAARSDEQAPGPPADRRLIERRRTPRARAGESWFGTKAAAPRRGAGAEVRRVLADADGVQPAASAADADPPTFGRIYRTFVAARAALGLALVIALVVAGVFGARPPWGVAVVSIVYAILSMGLWLLPAEEPVTAPGALDLLRGPQWLATIGIDLVCFLALHLTSPGSSFNYVALLVLPVLMAGVLTPRIAALATSAAITIGLLASGWLAELGGTDSAASLTQAGLAGTGFFAITILASELADRLAREEQSARGSLELARQQAQLNRLVIVEMQDGVLVVDREGRVRTANPAALRLLSQRELPDPAPFQLRGVRAWDALVRSVERAFKEAAWPEAGRDVELSFDNGTTRVLRVRVRFTREGASAAHEDLCVLFLEDVRNMQARSRQEKLAAMGRVSAGIAHEIRNPLAAIAQANALLSEDATDPGQRRLMRMVTDNVERLKRLVDDVMEVAPGTAHPVGVIDATAQIAAVCSEWARSSELPLGEASRLRVHLPDEPMGVSFDAEHLRRVLVNLLDNAARHSSDAPGAIRLRLDSRHEGQAFLSIASDGPPIRPDVEPYLFEPFFSTRSRGTGLGLYICRELCERYGATIGYRLRSDPEGPRNEFFVDMRSQTLGPVEARLQLTS